MRKTCVTIAIFSIYFLHATPNTIACTANTSTDVYTKKHSKTKPQQKGTAMNQATLQPFSPLACSVQPGSIYEHYKGMRYKILGVARHSETLEEMVVYQALYGEGDIWVRPIAMFLENITINDKSIPRFTKREL